MGVSLRVGMLLPGGNEPWENVFKGNSRLYKHKLYKETGWRG